MNTRTRLRDLDSEVMHLRSELNAEKKLSKSLAKKHGLFRTVVDEMRPRIMPLAPLPKARKPRPIKGKLIEEDVVMHVSDGHHDQIVRPEECGGLEEHNFSIACRRAETYVDTVLDWTQGTLRPRFKFKRLWVLAYGDHTSGEIHGHVTRSAFRNQFYNTIAIGQLHALMLRDLAPHFDAVNVVYLPGNHGRRSPKKDYHGAHDNWDYLVAKICQFHCHDIDNVSFAIPNAWSMNLVINGIGFNVAHGDDTPSHGGIPFYGMVRRQRGLLALMALKEGPRIRIPVQGHHHASATMADGDGEMICNGSWLFTDAYVFNRLTGGREPSQWLHGVHKKYGATWRLPVHLRTADEAKGPRRYKINIEGAA